MMKTENIIIFNRDHLRRNRTRIAKRFSDYDFLFRWTAQELSSRLEDINRNFPNALQIGSRTNLSGHPKIGTLFTMDIGNNPVTQTPHYFQASEEFLPLKAQSLDLVISALNLHTINDLPGALIQVRQALKPDGLFLAAMLGGETLHELRQSMTQAELNLTGGISPRIAPFADKPQMGDLLQRAGFALPVVDSEIITVTYDTVFKLFHDLRGMGEGNIIAARNKKFSSKSLFLETAKIYQEKFSEPDGRIRASFEIIFLLGWAPHASQQKPLRPGSAKSRLADALSTEEIKTGDKATP